MKSGLEGRNNLNKDGEDFDALVRLNEVRPRRPEQSRIWNGRHSALTVSMKSGLEGRNNRPRCEAS